MLSIGLMVQELGQLLVTGFGFGFLACAIVIITIVSMVNPVSLTSGSFPIAGA